MIRLLRTAELSPDRVVATLARPHAAADPDAVARVAAIVDEDFVKRSSLIHYTPAGLRAAWPHLAALAAAEGLHGHGEAARIRLEGSRTGGDH